MIFLPLLIFFLLVSQVAAADCAWVLWVKIDSIDNTPAKNVKLGNLERGNRTQHLILGKSV